MHKIIKRIENLEEINSILIERLKIYKRIILKLGNDHLELKKKCQELEEKYTENELKTTQYLHDLLLSKPNDKFADVMKEIKEVDEKYIKGTQTNFDNDLDKELNAVRDIIRVNEELSESDAELLEEILKD